WYFFKGRSRVTPRLKDMNLQSGEMPPFVTWVNFEKMDVDVMPDPKFLNEQGRSIQYHLDKKNFEMLSISDLSSYLQKQPEWMAAAASPKVRDMIQKRTKSLTFGIHDKIATPLVCLAVVLIGAPLGVRPQRSASAGIAMGLSLAAL